MSKTGPELERWTWKRWTFIGMVAAAFAYLCIVFAGFLGEANTTFSGATEIDDSKLSSMIVHRRAFTPPTDTLIRISSIHFFERVLRGLDTMQASDKNNTKNRRKFLSDLFNSYSISIDEYKWLRKQIIRTMRLGVQDGRYTTRQTANHIHLWLMEPVLPEHILRADSLNIGRMRLAAPSLIRHASPLVNKADAEALQ